MNEHKFVSHSDGKVFYTCAFKISPWFRFRKVNKRFPRGKVRDRELPLPISTTGGYNPLEVEV